MIALFSRARLTGAVSLLAAMLAPIGVRADPVTATRILDTAEKTMIVDPTKVVALVAQGRRALAEDRGSVIDRLRLRADWLDAEALGRLNRIDEAKTRIDAALQTIARVEPGGLLHGNMLMTRGAIALDQGEVQVAFNAYRRAFGMFQRGGDTRRQALALQNIGTIYSDAGDQQSVLRYYAQSAEIYAGDPGIAVSARNNLGLAYKELGQLDRADAEYRAALAIARKMDSALLTARILNNIAAVELLRGRLQAAEAAADQGLAAAASEGARDWAPFLWGTKAQIAFKRGDLPRTLALLDRTFAGTTPATTNFYFRDFHATAADAYARAGRADQALEHLRAFKRLDDEAREIRTSTNAALTAAQFDFSNQELKISRLREGQLKRDALIQRDRARTQWIILAGVLALLCATLIGFFSVRRSRNQTRAANANLAESNRALDKALKAKTEFLATTSHEIRTPLNGILGMTQVLLGARDLDAAVRERVRLIDGAGNMMKSIVDDILDVAKMETGEIVVECAPIDLHAALADIARLWEIEADAKGVALTIDLEAAPRRVLGDERKLRQIVFNLMSNAVKFTDAGHVALTARMHDDAVLEVVVEDSGVGIPASECAAIFEPFHQVDGSKTRTHSGTGLGLAICAKLSGALGGAITVDSVVGRGSRFTLRVPIECMTVTVDEAFTPPKFAKDAHAVVIDANPLFRSIVAASLGGVVAAVTPVADLAAADDAMAMKRADVMVIDPAGLDAALLRDWLAKCATPVVLFAPDGDAAAAALRDEGLVAAVTPKALPPVGLATVLEALFDEAPAPTAIAA